MGLCLKDLERFREAIALLEKAGAADPERTDVFNLMGYCYFRLKEHEKAIECFREVLKLNPSSAIDYANIASNYRDMGGAGKRSRTTGLPSNWTPDRFCKGEPGQAASLRGGGQDRIEE